MSKGRGDDSDINIYAIRHHTLYVHVFNDGRHLWPREVSQLNDFECGMFVFAVIETSFQQNPTKSVGLVLTN